jgi:hypothetical protein
LKNQIFPVGWGLTEVLFQQIFACGKKLLTTLYFWGGYTMSAGMKMPDQSLENLEFSDYLDDNVLERIRQDLDGQFTVEKIREVSFEVAQEFQGAVVTAFLPIFIYRRTREKLMRMLDQRGGSIVK